PSPRKLDKRACQIDGGSCLAISDRGTRDGQNRETSFSRQLLKTVTDRAILFRLERCRRKEAHEVGVYVPRRLCRCWLVEFDIALPLVLRGLLHQRGR